MSCLCGVYSVTFLYAGLGTSICILFLVTCLLVNEIFTEEYVDISEIKESSSYKTIYESEITPSNNFLFITSSETPFQNPFYTLLINNKKGYVYEHNNNQAITSNKEEKSFNFAKNIENLERSNKVVPIKENKPVINIKNETNADSNIAFRLDDSYKPDTLTPSTTTRGTTPFTISTVPSSDNLSERKQKNHGPLQKDKNNKDIKYIYCKDTFKNTCDGVKNQDVSTRTDSVAINNLETQTDCYLNTLDACCSAMTFKQIATIVQTDSVSIIDRKKYRNCSTSMSMHVMEKVSIYTSTSTPKCFSKCMQVDSGILGTRKAFKNRCTSATQVHQMEQWIQTDPVISRIRSESHKKCVSAGAIHVNSSEKCEICQIKRIMENIDRTIEKDKNKYTTNTGVRKKEENSRAHCSTNCKPTKSITQTIEQRSKKIGKKVSSNGSSDAEEGSFYIPKVLHKSWKNDPKFRQVITNKESSTYISSFQPQNDGTDNNFKDENTNILHKLSLQAESYLNHARKIFKKMKENDPVVNHYRTIKNDILKGYPHSSRTKKVTINEFDRKIEKNIKYNPKSETEIFKKSQTEVTIKNGFPELNITIKTPNKNLKTSKIRIRTKQTPKISKEDKLVTSSKQTTFDKKNVNISSRGADTTKTSTKRVTIINSNAEISASKNKLYTNQSASMISLTHSQSQKCLKLKNSCVTFKNEKQGQNLTKTTQRTIPLSQEYKIPKPKIKQTTVYPRYNVRTCLSRNINVKPSPTYPRRTTCHTSYLTAPCYNTTPVLPTQNKNTCEKACYTKCEIPCNNLQPNLTGSQTYWSCCPPQSSSIRSSQMYSQCFDKKPTCRSFYQCNLGNPSGQCVKKPNCEDYYYRRC